MQDSLRSASAAGWQWVEENGLIAADALRPAAPLGHLYSYLIASGLVVPMPSISLSPTTRWVLLHRTSKEWFFNWLSKTLFALLLIEFRKKEAQRPASFDNPKSVTSIIAR
jgi:hypothetical protein